MEKIDLLPVFKVKSNSVRAKEPTGKSQWWIFFSILDNGREEDFAYKHTEFPLGDQYIVKRDFISSQQSNSMIFYREKIRKKNKNEWKFHWNNQ